MDSPEQTDFPITIAGTEYTLAFPIPAVWKYEEISGQDLTSGKDKRTQEERLAVEASKTARERIKDTCDLLWAGLTTHHPEITREQVDVMTTALTLRGFYAVTQRVIEAWGASLPQAEEKQGSDPLAQTIPAS